MKIEQWPIDKPIPYARNPRVIPGSAVAKVASSIKEFGFVQPVVVDEDGEVIIGHTRLQALKRLGHATVDVHVAAGLSSTQVKALRLMDNRSHEEASWDDELLVLELEDLGEDGLALELAGFDELDLEALQGSSPEGRGGGEGVTAEGYSIQYAIVFEDEAQQDRWYDYLAHLKREYPEEGTIAGRIMRDLDARGIG